MSVEATAKAKLEAADQPPPASVEPEPMKATEAGEETEADDASS